VKKQQVIGSGDTVVEMVAVDLRRTFLGMREFSPANVWKCANSTWFIINEPILAQAVRELARVAGRGQSG